MRALSLVVVALTGCSFAPRESAATSDGPLVGADARPIDASAADGPLAIDSASVDAPIDGSVDAASGPPTLTVGSAAPTCDSYMTGGSGFASPTFTWTATATDGAPVTFSCASGNGSAAPTPLPAGSACVSGTTFGPFTQGDHWVVITAADDMGSATTYEDDFTVDTSGPQVTVRLSCDTDSADASWSYTLVGAHCLTASGEWTYYQAGGGGVPAGSGDALAGSSVEIPVRPTEFAVQITDLGMMAGGNVATCE